VLALLTGRRGGALLVAAFCLTAGCHDDPDTPVPELDQLRGDEAVVDYATWPLGRLESAVEPPACAAPVPSQRYFRTLTPDQASEHGFGIAEGYVEVARLGADVPAPCPFEADEARSSVVSQAITVFLNDPAARRAYGDYGECMSDEGVEGAANPMEAELLVVKRYSSIVDSETVVGADGGQPGTPDSEVLAHGDELLEFDRRIATASVRCQAVTVAASSDELVAAQRRVIDTAPAEQRELLDG